MGRLNKRLPLLMLVLALGVLTGLNVFWIRMDTAEMYRTEQPKFVTVRSFAEPDFLYEECSYYPPAYFWTCARAVSFFRVPLSYDHCLFVNILYMIAALIGMFLLGKHLTSSSWYGLLAAMLLAGLPLYLHISRKFIGEFAVTTWVIFAMYFLISNARWEHKGKSLAFGIICGIGMLFKWSFIIYISAPLFLSLYHGCFKQKQSGKKVFLKHVLLSFLAALVVCGYWYAVYFDLTVFFDQVFENLYDAQHISSSYFLFFKQNLVRSFQVLLLSGSWVFCALAAIAVVLSLKKIFRRMDYAMIFLWFAVSYAVFVCLGGEVLPRYMLPAFPALILMIVLMVFSYVRKKTVVLSLAVAFLAIGGIAYESFINRPPQRHASTPFDNILQYIIDQGGEPRIVFNGIHDSVTDGEILDLYNLFNVHDIQRRLGMDLIYVKTHDGLFRNLHAPFILSQDLSANDDVHVFMRTHGYHFVDRFSHDYHENTNPPDDWSAWNEYLLFEKAGDPARQ